MSTMHTDFSEDEELSADLRPRLLVEIDVEDSIPENFEPSAERIEEILEVFLNYDPDFRFRYRDGHVRSVTQDIELIAQRFELLCRRMSQDADESRRDSQEERIKKIEEIVKKIKWDAGIGVLAGVVSGLFTIAGATFAPVNGQPHQYSQFCKAGSEITSAVGQTSSKLFEGSRTGNQALADMIKQRTDDLLSQKQESKEFRRGAKEALQQIARDVKDSVQQILR